MRKIYKAIMAMLIAFAAMFSVQKVPAYAETGKLDPVDEDNLVSSTLKKNIL